MTELSFKEFKLKHELLRVEHREAEVARSDGDVRKVATWVCDCTQSGTTAAQWPGEDMQDKAEGNHRAHVRREWRRALRREQEK